MKSMQNARWQASIVLAASLLGCEADREPTELPEGVLERPGTPVPTVSTSSADMAGRPTSAQRVESASTDPSTASFEHIGGSSTAGTATYGNQRPQTIIGQPVKVSSQPAASQSNYNVYYTLRPNETAWDVARTHHVRADLLLAANHLTYEQAAQLTTGTTLVVPGTAANADSAPEPPAFASPGSSPGSVGPAAVPGTDTTPRHRPAIITHLISGGETLLSLARLYNVPAAAIAEANGIQNAPGPLAPGATLVIPYVTNTRNAAAPAAPAAQVATTVVQQTQPPALAQAEVRAFVIKHVLVKGETLAGVAQRYQVSVEAIMARNDLRPADLTNLYAGDVLLIPASNRQ